MAERTRRGVLAGGAAVVVLAGGGVAYAMTGGSGPAYRLASVVRADVQQTVEESGTVATVNQANASFPVAGEVASVAVQLGDQVRAGQTLATLNRTSLDQALQSADSTAAAARQTLANDEATQAGTGTGTSSAGERLLTASHSGPTGQPTGGSGSGATRALQQAVTGAQRDLDRAVAGVDRDVAAAVSACKTGAAGSVTVAVTADSTGTVHGDVGSAAPVTVTLENPDGSPVTGSTPAGPQTGVTGSYTFSGLTAGQGYKVVVTPPDTIGTANECSAAVARTDQDQGRVDAAEQALRKAVADLDAALAKAGSGSGTPSTGSSGSGGATAGKSGNRGSQGGSATGSSGSSGPSGSSGSSGTSGSSGAKSGAKSGATTVITAEQLAADQKAIDAADAEVAVAQQALDSATLTAPISGTVAAVGITAGSSVSAGSSTAVITVLGSGQRSVTTTVGIADVDRVRKGTTATVSVDGVSTPLSGTVSYIGTLNTDGTSGSTSTYPVTILLAATSVPVLDGAGASVALHVGAADGVLTVPTSAIHRLGSRTTVSVYSGGQVTTTPVTIGVQGSDRTQVVSGLTAGQQVVLAEVSAPVPSNSIQTGRFGGAGGLGRLGGGGAALTRLGGG